MLIAMLLIAAAPDQQVPERVEAVLPPLAAATRGLVVDRPRLDVGIAALSDQQPRLEIDLTILFEDAAAAPDDEEVGRMTDEAVARLTQAVEEAEREQVPAASVAGPPSSATPGSD